MHKKKYKEKYERKINKKDMFIRKHINIKWIILITIAAFLITLFFSVGSEFLMKRVNIYFGIVVIIFFIVLGVATDMLGIAVTSAEEEPFHSMATKKLKGARLAIKMIKNAEKVSAFCNDVIGDICSIMSGSAGLFIAGVLSTKYNVDLVLITLIMTCLIASFTIGGKAIGKSIAINKSEMIVYDFAKVLNVFYK